MTCKHESGCEDYTPVEVEPVIKVEVGDIVWQNCYAPHICEIVEIDKYDHTCRVFNEQYNHWMSMSAIRPAVPADFERTVQGVKVRLYAREGGSALAAANDTSYIDDNYTSSEVILHALANVPCDDGPTGVPPIPLSVSKGKFEAPK